MDLCKQSNNAYGSINQQNFQISMGYYFVRFDLYIIPCLILHPSESIVLFQIKQHLINYRNSKFHAQKIIWNRNKIKTKLKQN